MRPRTMRRIILLALAIVADLLVIAAWATRPAFLYSHRLGLGLGFVGDPHYPPLDFIRAWLRGELAPWTPTGFLSIFAPEDVAILTSLLVALVVLTAALVTARSRQTREGTRASGPHWSCIVRLRVRTALIAVAVVGLGLGWELESWKDWELRQLHLLHAGGHATWEAGYAKSLQHLRTELARLESSSFREPEDTKTPEARAAEEAIARKRLTVQIAYYQAMLLASARLKDKYRRAANDPRRPVEPDPPLPAAPELWPLVFMRSTPAKDLAALNEQIRLYPALAGAHERKARILATCADSQLRDGRAAVAAATRACELTNWKSPNALVTLAAAYAEAGDLGLAVRWQQRGMDRFAGSHPGDPGNQHLTSQVDERIRKLMQDCLDLYKTGKPFRGDWPSYWVD